MVEPNGEQKRLEAQSEGFDAGVPAGGEEEVALILQRESPRPLPAIAEVLMRHLDLHHTDVMAKLRYGGGLLTDRIPLQVGETIAAELQDVGVLARCIDSVLWHSVSHGVRAYQLSFIDDEVSVGLVGGRLLLFPKRDVVGMHLYGLVPPPPEAEEPRYMRRWKKYRDREKPRDDKKLRMALDCVSSVGPDGVDLTARACRLLENLKDIGAEGMEFFLTLFCYREGEAVPVRVRKNDFDFSCLGERKEKHSLDNFLVLLDTLVDELPMAWNRDRMQAFVEELDPKPILYFKEEEAENYDRWMVQWVELERQPGAGADRGRENADDPPTDGVAADDGFEGDVSEGDVSEGDVREDDVLEDDVSEEDVLSDDAPNDDVATDEASGEAASRGDGSEGARDASDFSDLGMEPLELESLKLESLEFEEASDPAESSEERDDGGPL